MIAATSPGLGARHYRGVSPVLTAIGAAIDRLPAVTAQTMRQAILSAIQARYDAGEPDTQLNSLAAAAPPRSQEAAVGSAIRAFALGCDSAAVEALRPLLTAAEARSLRAAAKAAAMHGM